MYFVWQKIPPRTPPEIFRRNFWSLLIEPEMTGNGFKLAIIVQSAWNRYQNEF